MSLKRAATRISSDRQREMNAPLRRPNSEAENALNQRLRKALPRKLPGQERVRALRADAAALFGTQGLPTRRVEAWHYSDLRAQMKDALPLAARPECVGARRACARSCRQCRKGRSAPFSWMAISRRSSARTGDIGHHDADAR